MATLKVGQRVRFVRPECWYHLQGNEGVVCGYTPGGLLMVDLEGAPVHPGRFYEYQFAPLTPPAEDAWATEAVRKVTKPQHVEPVAPKAPARV